MPQLRGGGTLALGVLLVADLVLVGAVLRAQSTADSGVEVRTKGAPATSTASETRSPSSEASTPSTSTGTASATSSPPAEDAVPLTVLVGAVSRDVGWRASSPGCAPSGSGTAAKAVVEVSTDGGTSWSASDFPDEVVVRVRPTSATEAFTISSRSAQDCAGVYRSTSNGRSWSGGTGPQNAWYRSPIDATEVRAPGELGSTPCRQGSEVVDLVVISSGRAAALCSDRRVVETTDGSRSWQTVETVPGAVALADDPTGSGYAVAVLGRESCAGAAFVTVDPEPRQLGCAEGAGSAGPGKVAVSTVGRTVWLVAGEGTYRSTDRGTTFVRRDA